MYLDAIKSMPKPDSKLQTEKGDAVHMKTDVFKRIIWYAYKGENGMVALTPERVAEIKKLNKDGVKPKDLADFAQVKEKVEEIGYQNVVGQDSLTRFDEARRKKRKRGGRDRDRGRSPGSGPAPSGAAPSGAAPQRSAPPRPAPPRTDGPRPASSGPAAPRPSEGASGGEGGNRSRRNRNRGRDRRKPGNETPRPDAG
jgi:hypothetical protein